MASFSIAIAQTVNTKCSLNGLSILYLNGVNSTPEKGINEIEEATKIFRSKLDEENVRYKVLENHSEGIIDDIVEFTIQKEREKAGRSSTTLEEDLLAAELVLTSVESQASKNSIVLSAVFSFFDFKSVLKKYQETFNKLVSDVRSRLLNNEKVLVVAHSQGNMFMNEIRHKLMNDSDPRVIEKTMLYLRDYPVGSPAASSAEDTFSSIKSSFKLSEDVATGILGNSGGYSKADPSSKKEGDFLSHGFIETYMNASLLVVNKNTSEQSYARNVLINDIVEIAKRFPPNCCHTSSGKDGNGRVLFEQGGDNFVSFGASVDTSVGLSGGAEVCGGSIHGNVSVGGNVHIYGSPEISGSVPGIGESIEIFSSSNNPIIISGGKISGQRVRISSVNAFGKSLIIRDDAEIQGCNTSISQDDISNEMVIGDNSKISGNVNILSTSISDDASLEGSSISPCTSETSQAWFSKITGNSTIKSGSAYASSVFGGVIERAAVSQSSISESQVVDYSTVYKSDISNGSRVSQSVVESSSVNGSYVMSNSHIASGAMITACVVVNSNLSSVGFSEKTFLNCTCDGQNDSDPEDPCSVCMRRFLGIHFEI